MSDSSIIESSQEMTSEITQAKTAAILLIGNELLSGKIKDENAYYLAKRLRALGVSLERILVVPDDRETIANHVVEMSQSFDHVFTSGGVGPTHDDITLESIAHGFKKPLTLDDRLHELLKSYFKERLNDAHLRMAQIPEGSTLLWTEGAPWPVYSFGNVYILPGVPQVFRAKFEEVASRFRHGAFYLRSLYLNAREGEIAQLLTQLEADFEVSVGSYPNLYEDLDYRVRVTVESRQMNAVDEAVSALHSQLVKLEASSDRGAYVVRIDEALS